VLSNGFAIAVNLLVFVLGSAIGSFLNVVIYRLPAGLSLWYPPSRCPKCLTRLGKRENVPILGWLWLRGRCRHCHAPIAPRYPLVEFCTGALFLGTYWHFGPNLSAIAAVVLLSWLIALALIDCDTLTLPNSLTQSGLIVGLLFAIALGWQETQTLTGSLNVLMTRIIGVVVGLWGLELIAFCGSLSFGRTAMGAGDAKLAAMLGAWLGLGGVALSGFLACALGAVLGGGAIVVGWRDRQQPMPFGPFLALGAMMALFWGEIIWTTYQTLFWHTSGG
jgi:leader peptidase (prepilin peptidase)/N-methyltransferase